MSNYIVTDEELTDVADAIREKGGTSALLSWPTEYVEAIGDIQTGGSASGSMDDPIRFFDYDGTVVASYTSVPSTLPPNPSHTGLVAQGWNYTLAEIQEQFADTGACDVGQMYITESGDTEIDIVLHASRLEPYLSLAPNGTVTIDWGDGSATDTVNGTSLTTQKRTKHTYATAGTYTISVHVVTGTVSLYATSTYPLLNANSSAATNNIVYANAVHAIRIGANTSVGSYAFSQLATLVSVTIPDSVTSLSTYAFNYCYSLASIVLPKGITSIGMYTFHQNYSLSSISMPIGVTSIGANSFNTCRSLRRCALPKNITFMGASAFSGCMSLSAMIIPTGITNIPNGVYTACISLASIVIPNGVITIGNSVFSECSSLYSVGIPDSVHSFGSSVFSSCITLQDIVLPDAIETLPLSMFRSCTSLASATIPASVTTMGNQVFDGCYGLGDVYFLPTTPPTTGTNTWRYLPTDCVIHVPAGTLEAYTTASNYPDPTKYTYVEDAA